MTALTAVRTRLQNRSTRTRLIAVLAAAAAALVLSACHYVGSGTITSASGKGKATFTFNVSCTAGKSSGVLTYVDNNAGVMIHAVGGTTTASCTPTGFPPFEDISGTYTPLKGGTGGTFDLYLDGGGTAYSYSGFFALDLSGGVYNGYSNSGDVTVGNIVVNP